MSAPTRPPAASCSPIPDGTDSPLFGTPSINDPEVAAAVRLLRATGDEGGAAEGDIDPVFDGILPCLGEPPKASAAQQADPPCTHGLEKQSTDIRVPHSGRRHRQDDANGIAVMRREIRRVAPDHAIGAADV